MKNDKNNHPVQPRPQKSKEQIEMEMKMKEQTEKITKMMNTIFLPALKKQAPKLLEAGRLSEKLAQIVSSFFNKKSLEIKISDLGIFEMLDEVLKTDKDANNTLIYTHQRAILEECKEWSVAEFQQIIQWYAQAANKHAEHAVSEVNMEDAFAVLKEGSEENIKANEENKEIVSPIQPVLEDQKPV